MRKLDHRTMTYAFDDGSGVITEEQVQQRKLLAVEIGTMKAEYKGDLKTGSRIAGMVLKYLTFFSK